MKNRGITLLELSVTGTVVGAMFVILTFTYKSLQKASQRIREKGAAEISLMTAYGTIMDVGRLSQLCKSTGPFTELNCEMNFNTPPTAGANTNVRFRLVGTNLLYEVEVAGVYQVRATYPDITEFTACKAPDMTILGTTCPIQPVAISVEAAKDRGVGGADATPADRFYRFRITQRLSPKSDPNAEKLTVQGAFYVRNPVQVNGGLASYQWGGSN